LVQLPTELGAHIVAKEILSDDLEPLSTSSVNTPIADVNLILTGGWVSPFAIHEATVASSNGSPGLSKRAHQALKNTPLYDLPRRQWHSIIDSDREPARLTQSRPRVSNHQTCLITQSICWRRHDTRDNGRSPRFPPEYWTLLI
jgi:hypothetical protein